MGAKKPTEEAAIYRPSAAARPNAPSTDGPQRCQKHRPRRRREVQKQETIYQRFRYNLAQPLGEPGSELSLP